MSVTLRISQGQAMCKAGLMQQPTQSSFASSVSSIFHIPPPSLFESIGWLFKAQGSQPNPHPFGSPFLAPSRMSVIEKLTGRKAVLMVAITEISRLGQSPPLSTHSSIPTQYSSSSSSDQYSTSYTSSSAPFSESSSPR